VDGDRAASTKERIIKESIRLFLKKGYRGTSVKDITDGARISKGAFYWHFKSKDELLENIVDEYERVYIDGFIDAVRKTEGSFESRFKFSHKYATDFAYENRDLCVGFMTLAAELSGSGTQAESRIKTIYAKYRAFMEELIEEGKKGEVRQDLDTGMISHVITAIHNGMLLEWYMNVDTIDGKQLAKTYKDVMLKGILA
jgi:AcrR family transcriptional regulator